jgi:hypothetical protein
MHVLSEGRLSDRAIFRRTQQPANAPLPPLLVFRAAGRPVSLFSVPLERGNGAPGGAEGLRGPLGRTLRSVRPDAPSFRGRLARPAAWRAGPGEEPCASRRSTAMPLSGIATLLRRPTPRSTTPALNKAGEKIRPVRRAGISLFWALVACMSASEMRAACPGFR